MAVEKENQRRNLKNAADLKKISRVLQTKGRLCKAFLKERAKERG